MTKKTPNKPEDRSCIVLFELSSPCKWQLCKLGGDYIERPLGQPIATLLSQKWATLHLWPTCTVRQITSSCGQTAAFSAQLWLTQRLLSIKNAFNPQCHNSASTVSTRRDAFTYQQLSETLNELRRYTDEFNCKSKANSHVCPTEVWTRVKLRHSLTPCPVDASCFTACKSRQTVSPHPQRYSPSVRIYAYLTIPTVTS